LEGCVETNFREKGKRFRDRGSESQKNERERNGMRTKPPSDPTRVLGKIFAKGTLPVPKKPIGTNTCGGPRAKKLAGPVVPWGVLGE